MCPSVHTCQSTCFRVTQTQPQVPHLKPNDSLLTGPLTQAFLTLCVFSPYTQSEYSLRYTVISHASVALEWLLGYFGRGKLRLPTWIQGWKKGLSSKHRTSHFHAPLARPKPRKQRISFFWHLLLVCRANPQQACLTCALQEGEELLTVSAV